MIAPDSSSTNNTTDTTQPITRPIFPPALKFSQAVVNGPLLGALFKMFSDFLNYMYEILVYFILFL